MWESLLCQLVAINNIRGGIVDKRRRRVRCMHAVYRDDARQPPEVVEEEERDDAERACSRLPIFLRNTLFALVAFFFTVSV